MIIGNIKDCEKYYNVNPNFKKAFEWLKGVKSEPCDKILIDGENVWGKVEEDKPRNNEAVYEAHKKFIDIHYMLKGTEKFGWSDIGSLKNIKEYDSDADYELLSGTVNPINLEEGYFCVVFPEDAHIPALEVQNDGVLRGLVKIRV